MNPVLLKPQAGHTAQIVLCGKVLRAASAREYRALAPSLMPMVLGAFGQIAADADLVLVEGAGSPAEINLRAGDIANMGFAEAADVPVTLVGDIDRGGIIAQLVGTHALLSAAERARLAGYIVNKFRGDPRLFDDGITAIGERTGLPCFGVVPWFAEAYLFPAEDSMALSASTPTQSRSASSQLKIAVPVLPYIANFDDLDPLRAEPHVELVLVRSGQPLPGDAALVILPGSKATLADLAALRREGWDIDILAHHRRGGHVLGICGGYQMLGRAIADPDGIEGAAGTVAGLGLLDIDTALGSEKRLGEVSGIDIASGAPLRGYEMHLGVTTGKGLEQPMLQLERRPEGAVSPGGRITGCYLHGLFASDSFRRNFLARLGAVPSGLAYDAMIDDTLDRLADHLAASLDLAALLAAARPPLLTKAA